MRILCYINLLAFVGEGAAVAAVWMNAADPILITQPAYSGMQFYVYRPYNIPGGWYATYDGYPVFRNADGIWVYGSCVGANIVPTAYVVGSVVPSVAGLFFVLYPIALQLFRENDISANLVLNDADHALNDAGYGYARFADDIVVCHHHVAGIPYSLAPGEADDAVAVELSVGIAADVGDVRVGREERNLEIGRAHV